MCAFQVLDIAYQMLGVGGLSLVNKYQGDVVLPRPTNDRNCTSRTSATIAVRTLKIHNITARKLLNVKLCSDVKAEQCVIGESPPKALSEPHFFCVTSSPPNAHERRLTYSTSLRFVYTCWYPFLRHE